MYILESCETQKAVITKAHEKKHKNLERDNNININLNHIQNNHNFDNNKTMVIQKNVM